MFMCANCEKRPNRIAWSRHKKGSSGASEWPLRAQINKRTQLPNLHVFKGVKYCTKCLRMAKELYRATQTYKPVAEVKVEAVAAIPQA